MAQLTEPISPVKREDLSDQLVVVDQRQTPVMSMLKKDPSPTNTLFEWTVDSYDAPSTKGTIDGTDVSSWANKAANRAKLKNHIQVVRRTAKVSRLAENLSTVPGVSSEIGHAAKRCLTEMARDIECVILSDNNSQTDDGTKPYLTRGIGKWIVSSDSDQYPVPSAHLPSTDQIIATATASLYEDTHIQGILQAVFDATGFSGDFKLIAGSILRRRFTDMTRTVTNAAPNGGAARARSFNADLNSKTLTESVTSYSGDYGTIEILSSNWIGASADSDSATPDKDRGYLIDMDKFSMCFNKRPSAERLTDEGGGPRVLVETVFGTKCLSPKGCGKFQP